MEIGKSLLCYGKKKFSHVTQCLRPVDSGHSETTNNMSILREIIHITTSQISPLYTHHFTNIYNYDLQLRRCLFLITYVTKPATKDALLRTSSTGGAEPRVIAYKIAGLYSHTVFRDS